VPWPLPWFCFHEPPRGTPLTSGRTIPHSVVAFATVKSKTYSRISDSCLRHDRPERTKPSSVPMKQPWHGVSKRTETCLPPGPCQLALTRKRDQDRLVEPNTVEICLESSEDWEAGRAGRAKALVSSGHRRATALRKSRMLQRQCQQSPTPIKHNMKSRDDVACAQVPWTMRGREEQKAGAWGRGPVLVLPLSPPGP
jgi:hypothetical protein